VGKYSVEVKPAAQKELEALSDELPARVVRKLSSLADASRPAGCKKLKGYEDQWRIRVGDWRNEPRQLVLDPGMVPPKSNRLHPWDYDHAIYKKRNEIERLFRRLKGFRRIFSRFEKLDVIFPGFLSFALIVEALRVV
jgi:hypothetical protein